VRTPIFIVSSDSEICVYATADEALASVESPDVEAGEYSMVFDAEGRPYNLVLERPTRYRRGWFLTSIELAPVRFEPLQSKPPYGDELRQLLVGRFPNVDPQSPLEELVSRAASELIVK
jgi:hypothetical protein